MLSSAQSARGLQSHKSLEVFLHTLGVRDPSASCGSVHLCVYVCEEHYAPLCSSFRTIARQELILTAVPLSVSLFGIGGRGSGWRTQLLRRSRSPSCSRSALPFLQLLEDSSAKVLIQNHAWFCLLSSLRIMKTLMIMMRNVWSIPIISTLHLIQAKNCPLRQEQDSFLFYVLSQIDVTIDYSGIHNYII